MSAHRPQSSSAAAHTPSSAHVPSAAHTPSHVPQAAAALSSSRPQLQHQGSASSVASTATQAPSRTASRTGGGPSRTPSRTGSMTRQSGSSGHLTAGMTGGGHPVWRDKDQTKHCCNVACNKPFGLLRTKNHCRWCGDIFCQDCLGFAMILPAPRIFIDGSSIPASTTAAVAAASGSGAVASRYPKGKLMPPVQGKVKLCKRCCSELHQMEMQAGKLSRAHPSQHQPQHTASNGSVSSAPTSAASAAAAAPSPLTSTDSTRNLFQQRVTRSSSNLRTAASSPTGDQSSGIEGQPRSTSTASAPAAAAASSAASAGALVRSGSRISARGASNTGATNHALVLQPSSDQLSTEDLAAIAALSSEFSSNLEQLEQCRLDEGGQMQALKRMLDLLHQGALMRLANPYAAFVAILDFASGATFAGAQAAVHVQTVELLQLLSLALLNAPGDMITLYQSAHVSHENALESLTHLIESQGERLPGRQHCVYLLSATTCVLHLLSHTDTHRTHLARHGRNLILTGLAFFGLGDVPLTHMLDELGHAVQTMFGARKAKQVYPRMMRMWLAMPRRDAVPTLESVRDLQATFGVYLGAESGSHWELPVTYLSLLHRWVQFLSRTDTCESLSIHQRQSLCLSLLFGALDPSGNPLPGLLSGKKFSNLCSRSDWKVREKVVQIAMDILADAGRSMPSAPQVPQRSGSRAQKKKELQIAAAAAACGSTSAASSAAAASGLSLTPSPHYSYPPMILELLSSLLLERQILERHPAVLETLRSGSRMHELKQALAAGWSRRKGEVELMLEAQGAAVAELQSSLERALGSAASAAELATIKSQLLQAQSEFTQSRSQITEISTVISGVASSVQEVLAKSTAIQSTLDAHSAVLSQIAAGTTRVEQEVKAMAAQLEAVSHEVRRSRDFTESIVAFQSMRAAASATPPATAGIESPNAASTATAASFSPAPTTARRVSGGAAATAAASPSPRNSVPSSHGASSPTTPLAAAAVGSRIPLFASSVTPGSRMTMPSGAGAAPRLVSPRPTAPVRAAAAGTAAVAAAAPVRSVSHKRRNHEIDADVVPPPPVAAAAAAAAPATAQPIKRARAQVTQAPVSAAARPAAAPSPRASAKPVAPTGGLSRTSAVAGAGTFSRAARS